MFEYPYEMIKGHVVLNIDDSFLLLDTGAPTSLGEDSVSIGDRRYPVQDNYLGITADYLTRKIGSRIDGMIRADIISHYTITIDTLRNKIAFSYGTIDFPISISIDEFMGIPILEVFVNGSQIRAFLDTGACLSYIDPELSEGMVPTGKMEDFYPGIGRFTTDIFELDTVIGGESFNLLYGHLPPLLQMTLMMANTQGIIGTELFKSYTCSLSIRERQFGMKRTRTQNTSEAKRQINPFIQILRKAEEKRWCMEPYCSTCGARDYRIALRDIGGKLGTPLVNVLAEIDRDELISFENWGDAVVIAVRDLPLPGQATALLESWLKRADQNIRFFDGVLYKLVRYMPESDPVRQKWIEKAVSLSVQTRDFSLVESLLLTLRERAVAYEQIIDIAREHAETSSQMRRVLRNACKIEM
jgi:hypothetical protein